MGATKQTIGLLAAGAAIVSMSSVAAARGGNGDKGGDGAVMSSISLNRPEAARVVELMQLGDTVTYSTSIEPLKGGEWPMVYTVCASVDDGAIVFGQLDHPGAAFVLGGGSSPWLTIGGDASCHAELLAYGGKARGVDTIRLLASTDAFYVVG